jgi:hypothetical protein
MKIIIGRLTPLLYLFGLILILLLTLQNFFKNLALDFNVLHGANLFFLSIFSISLLIHHATASNTNPHVFVRGVMAGMMLKIIATMIAVFSYTSLIGDNFDKKAIFIALCLYLPYLAAEKFATGKVKHKKDA